MYPKPVLTVLPILQPIYTEILLLNTERVVAEDTTDPVILVDGANPYIVKRQVQMHMLI